MLGLQCILNESVTARYVNMTSDHIYFSLFSPKETLTDLLFVSGSGRFPKVAGSQRDFVQ